MKFISLIALDDNRLIGTSDNKLPWPKVKEDMKFFKEFTMGKNLIMGRKTYEGLPVPLKNRNLFVLTSNPNIYGWQNSSFKNKEFSYSVNLFSKDEELPDGEYIICGGRQIYMKYLDKIDEWFVSYIQGQFIGSICMPEKFEENFSKAELVLETEKVKIIRFSERKIVEEKQNIIEEKVVQEIDGNTSSDSKLG